MNNSLEKGGRGGQGRWPHPSMLEIHMPHLGAKEGKVFPVKFLEASIFGQKSIHKKLQMRAVYIHVM